MDTYFRVIILILLGLKVTDSSGQAVTTTSNHPVPLDETITYGKLNNGLSYYIKHLPEDEKVYLRFHVLAGTNNQDPDQLNFAHFVEHMGFKSSTHFPNGIFSELLERKSLDMYQRDINAHPGRYNTYYRFKAPADNQEALETGLLWFKDIATGLHLKNEEIDTERGVLIQEYILSTPDNMEVAFPKEKLMFQLLPGTQNYSNFIEHHKTFDPERLKQFYKDWYRPDLMSIVIVGKIDDVPALERHIRNSFSDIKPKENLREIPDYDALFFDQSPQFVVVEKPSESLNGNEKVEIELFFRDRKTLDVISSKKGIQRRNKNGLLVKILNNRLREATMVYNNFFNFEVIHTHRSKVTIHPSSFKVRITTRHSREKEAVKTFTHILQQLRKHGVLDSEFMEAKKERINELEGTTSYESRYWLEEIQNNLVHKEALPNDKRGYMKNWLLNYEASEFNEFIKEINLDMPQDIGILAPANHPATSYTEVEIRSLINGLGDDSIPPYVKPEVPTILMASDEVEGLKESSYKERELGNSGARQLILENGVKVILKHMETSNPRKGIVLHGFSNRGALNFPPEDYFSAINAPLFIQNSGVGKFDKFDLRRFRKTNSLSIQGENPYIHNQESGFKIGADPKDAEAMLQMVYLFFSQPRKDTLAFQDWKVQQSLYYQNHRNLQQFGFHNNINKILGDNSGVSSGTERYLGIEETDMEKGFEIYKELFGSPQDFTFLVTGSFSVDSVTHLITKYLGSLPSIQPGSVKASNVNSIAAKPTGPVLVEFKSPNFNNITKNNYTYIPAYIVQANDEVNWKEKLIARALGGVISVEVGKLRFEKGYSLYSVGAAAQYNDYKNQHKFSATFSCPPEQYPLLRDEFAGIINSLKEELISEEVLEQALKKMRATEDPSGRGHSLHNIHEKLYNQYRFGVPWIDQKEIMSYIESITPVDILNAAQNYFIPENLYEFVMTY